MPRVSTEHLAARRRQILDAAATLFAERGFARTSMSDVVQASGLSMGAIYRYFPSKVELVVATGEGHGGEVGDGFPVERAAELLARLADEVGPGRSHARLSIQIWGEAAVEPQLAARVVPIHQRLQDHLVELLRDGVEPDEHGPEDEALAQVALSAVIGLAALVAAGVPVDQPRFVAALAGLVDPPPDEAPRG
ncbi:TetR/AcrR family transcriptional regulator [Pseudonocardia xinjiangensis]|uniref:TetR/AcrR family transcriptional regulator n=1 Tax=Pseudonocardia xinjiangensis TaxID=75289 RepID=UPI003D942EA2